MLKDYLLGLGLVIDNEWLDKYCELIENNKTTPRQPYKTQMHHIVPKFYFKVMAQSIDNSSANTVNLLIKDHLIAHYYLCGCATAKFKGKAFACISYILGHLNTLPDYKEFVKSLDHIEEYYLEYRKMINDAAHTTEAKEKASKSLKEFYANLDKNTEE